MSRRSVLVAVVGICVGAVLLPGSPAAAVSAAPVTTSGAATQLTTSLPTAPTSIVALRLPSGGVDLSWSPPQDWGGSGAIDYVIYRTSAAGTDRFTVPYSYQPAWADTSPPIGSTYAVSMVTEAGEGPASDPVQPRDAQDYVFTSWSADYGQPSHLGAVAMPGGTTPVSLPGKGWAAGLAVSPDGSSVLSSEPVDGGYALWRQPVDGSTAPVRLWIASASRLGRPAWSPDGTRVAVSAIADSGGAEVLHVLPAAGGSPTLSLPGLSEPAWLPDARTLLAHDATGLTQPLLRVDASTGRRLGTLTGTEGARLPTVSPDGRWIAFRRYDATGASSTFVVPVSGGTALQAPNQVGYSDVAWTLDGASLTAVLKPYYGFNGLYEIPVSAGGQPGDATPMFLRVSALLDGIARGGARVSIAPSPALTGRQATFISDPSALSAGATLRCAVDSGAATACANTFTTPPLATGTHTVRVHSVETSGRVTVAARTFAVDATAPVPSITSLPFALLGRTTTLRYGAVDSGGGTVVSYDVRYRYASPSSGFTAYSQPSGWQGLRSTSLSLKLAPGYTYCFRIRARDSLGNVSGWTGETCTRVPLDDRSLSGTGWTRGTSSYDVYGTYSRAAYKGRVLSTKAAARQVGLVVTTCSTCGAVDVRHAGVYLGRKSLASSTTKHKRVIWLPYGAYRSGTLTITTVSGKKVIIDAVLIRK